MYRGPSPFVGLHRRTSFTTDSTENGLLVLKRLRQGKQTLRKGVTVGVPTETVEPYPPIYLPCKLHRPLTLPHPFLLPPTTVRVENFL